MRHVRHSVILAAALVASAIPSAADAQLGRQQGLVEPNIAADSTLLKLPYLNADIVRRSRTRVRF